MNSITVSELIGITESNNNLPTNPIMISFDDGLEDAIENAVPILHDSGFQTAMMLPSVHDPVIIIVNHIKARDSNFQNKLYDLVLDYSLWLGVWSAAKKDTNGKLLISKIKSTSKN